MPSGINSGMEWSAKPHVVPGHQNNHVGAINTNSPTPARPQATLSGLATQSDQAALELRLVPTCTAQVPWSTPVPCWNASCVARPQRRSLPCAVHNIMRLPLRKTVGPSLAEPQRGFDLLHSSLLTSDPPKWVTTVRMQNKCKLAPCHTLHSVPPPIPHLSTQHLTIPRHSIRLAPGLAQAPRLGWVSPSGEQALPPGSWEFEPRAMSKQKGATNQPTVRQ